MSSAMEFRYDVFLSYSHHNAEWVQTWLFPRIEHAGLKVCIDIRDFEPGATSATEMERAVLTSRKTVLVLTPAYLASQWTEFENVMAQTLDPAARQRRMLPLMLEKCELPLRIGMLVYLDFTRAEQHAKQFARLIAAVQTG